MKEEDKNRKTGLSGFMDYMKDNLKGSERNAFERELQKDPFAMEAEEGLSTVDPDLIISDLDLLNKKINSRTGRSSKYILYRIAASIAVLVVVSSVFFLVQRNTPSKQESIAGSKSKTLLAKEEQGEKGDKKTETPALKVSAQKMKQEVKAVKSPNIPAEKSEGFNRVVIADSVNTKYKAEAGAVSDVITADAAIIKTKPDSAIIAAAEPQAAVQPENIPAGFGEKKARSVEATAVSRSESMKVEAYSRHIPAGPVNGMDSFYKYIEENIHRPDTLKGVGQVTVTISFFVRINGSPEGIKIIESPGKSFSDEAIRLVKEGPRWKPASENGVIKEEEVRLKIAFK